MFKRILIANRGEIACRLVKAARALGCETVAVYSKADENSPHVDEADRKICIGPAQSAASYLNIEAILQAALQEQCQALHPGYGFLAENSTFAYMCNQQKVTFIGPNPDMIQLMGNKNAAREAMTAAGLPIIPGSKGIVQNALAEAEEIGYPILLKAVAGGGGKGMRICRSAQDLEVNFVQATMEAEKAFGNPEMYMEKYIESGRHIEFQVLADNYGNVIHLGERECSVQRHHQKLIEESPSPAVTEAMRKEMGRQVVNAMRHIGYSNVGTIEFLMENNSKLYFMEMNTRLQVEHPVTEMVTGLDIAALQIKTAANHLLDIAQKDIVFKGHAIECRINAEDPTDNFKPSPGKITRFIPPQIEGKVRLDTHVKEGHTIPPFYDSMICKLIVHADNRDKAIATMIHALENFTIEGIHTTIPLHLQILKSDEFQSGNYDTRFIERMQK